MAHYDLRGFHLLDRDGMPYVTVEALRINSNMEPSSIDIIIDLDKHGNERHPANGDLDDLKPHVVRAVTDLQEVVGNLPLQFRKRMSDAHVAMSDNWLN